ncbi:MAG: twitching motility protein PilT [Aristaeellaceae bacterium]|nr:twitching motility protein PilT [Eubacteriales bacterium]
MIQIIAGKKGSGKTKRLINMTNDTAKTSSSSVVFLDKDNSYMFDVDRAVRFVNVNDYHVSNSDMFLGFLGGMLASNYDVGVIFVDAFIKLTHTELADAKPIIDTLEELGEKHRVKFVLSVSEDPALLPEFMKGYVI